LEILTDDTNAYAYGVKITDKEDIEAFVYDYIPFAVRHFENRSTLTSNILNPYK